MMKFIGILRHLISLTTIFDAVMCNDGFYPVHTQHVVGVEMDIENKVHTYLELAGANGVSAGSSLARLRHRWWKVRSFLRGKVSAVDGTV